MEKRKIKHLIIKRLIEVYKKNPDVIAKALDEEIDRSGNLLGWVREISIK